MEAEDKTIRDFYCSGRILDVGCGDPRRMRDLITHENTRRGAQGNAPLEFVSIDTNVIDPRTVLELDIRNARLSDFGGLFSTIICCRVFCNIPRSDHKHVVNTLALLLRKGGRLIVLDGWDRQRNKVQETRRKMGWDVLPPSSSGSQCIPEETELFLATRLRLDAEVSLAGDYTIWTRLMQKKLLPFGHPMAQAAPCYSFATHQKFAFYRARIYGLHG